MKTFSNTRKAFTLVELLIVIAIIGILFIVLISKVDFATDKAKISGVQTDFRSFQVALHTVATENDGFTNDIDILIKQVNKNLDESMKLNQNDEVITSNAKDPWGTNYHLIYDEPDGTRGIVTVISAGSDQQFYTKDDVAMSVKYEIGYEGGKIVVDMEGGGYCPHSYSDWTVLQDMTCTTDEIQERKCNYCGLTETSVINTTGHNFVDGFCTECSIEEIPAGLYLTGSNYTELLYTWQELIDMKLIEGTTSIRAYETTFSNKPSDKVLDGLTGDLKLPNEVTSIKDGGFYACKNITGLMFSGKTKSIGKYALFSCSGIKNVYFDTKVSWGYNGSPSLDNIYFKDLETFLGTTYALESSDDPMSIAQPVAQTSSIYINGKLLEELVIPEGTTKLNSIFVANYSKLTKVVLPESLTTLKNNLFNNCTGLVDINLNYITHIDMRALYGTGLTNIDLPNIIQIQKEAISNNILECININSSLEKISYKSIKGKEDFEIHFNGTLDQWSSAMYSHRNASGGVVNNVIHRLYINGQEMTGTFNVPEYWTEVPGGLFYYVYKINNLVMHDNVTNIGDYAFCKTNLCNIDMSNSLDTIGNSAFAYTLLTNVDLPDCVTQLGNSAFSNCKELVTFNIGHDSMLNSIGDNCFGGDEKLTSLFIPQYVKRLGSIISNCYALSSFTFHENSQLEYLGTSFSAQSSTDNFDIYLPDSVKEIYGLSITYGYDIKLHISENSQLEKIGYRCFERFGGELYIPKNVSYIADDCFWIRADPKVTVHPENTHFKVVDGCFIDIENKKLITSCIANSKNAIIPTDGSVTTLGAYSCDEVRYIPKIITSINSNAFSNPNLIYHYITYEGTVEEFKVLVPTLQLRNVKSITCSDGVIDASGNVTYN